MSRALLIVDAQYDFMPGGALPVPKGDKIIEPIQTLIKKFEYDHIFFTQDCHPADHCSFAEQGGPWPAHCVGGTEGMKIHKDLQQPIMITVMKGMDPNHDSYSGFYDDGGHETPLKSILDANHVDELFICGLATEYCVKFTVMDALKEGFKVTLVHDACHGINMDDEMDAIHEMIKAGAEVERSDLV